MEQRTHRRRILRSLSLAACMAMLWLAFPTQVQAQPNLADYVSRMDANGNGLLEPSEMSDRFQSFWSSTLRERGIDVSRPVPVDRISEIMRERFEQMRRDREEGGSSRYSRSSRGGDDGDRRSRYSRSRDRDDDNDDRRSRDRRSSDDEAAAMLVPGFGNDFEPLPIPGFDTLVENDDDWESQYDRRTLSTVRDILRRYDKDNSGVLEREEWANGQWRTDPASSDLDNDGRLTRKELAIRLAGFRNSDDDRDRDRRDSGDSDRGRGSWGGRERGGWFGSRESSEPSSESRSNSSNSRNETPTVTSYRFRTPTERLPKGMPEWFARKDVDGDGQVAMAEFASQWSPAEVAEFRSWDHNGDGIITANECLAGQRGGDMIASAGSSSGTPSSTGGDRTASSPTSGRSGFGGPGFGGPGASERSGFGGPGTSGGSGDSPGGSSRFRGSSSGSGGPSSPGASSTSSPQGGSTGGAATSSNPAPSNFSAGASNTYREIYTKKFREWDANRNSVLDGDEISSSVRSADRNGDGRITLDELLERFARPR